MGWLRDLLLRSEPPLRSLGELARRALEHPSWPDESKIQPRSLAALFSKLDRSQELDWLRDRPRELACLADVLGRPALELRVLLGDPPLRRDRRMLRLHDLRYGRDFDLVREELPPGFPPPLRHPVHWMVKPLVWLAPSGAGRTVLGAWLEARGLATYTRTQGDLEQISPDGAQFLDIAATEGLRPDDLLRLRAGERPLCFAVAHPSQVAAVQSAVKLVSCDEPEAYLRQLAEWVEARVGSEGHFDAERASEWIRRRILPQRALRTWGEMLGLLGLFDEVPARQWANADLQQVLTLLVQRRLRELNEPWVGSESVVLETLGRSAATLFLESEEGLESSRSAAAWVELFTRALAPTPASQPVSPQLLCRALLGTGLLRRDFIVSDDVEKYCLGPHILLALLRTWAESELLDSGPEAWGRALLLARSGPLADSLLLRIQERARTGNLRTHQDITEADFERSADPRALHVALEAVLETLPAILAEGIPLPSELLEELAEEAHRAVVLLGSRLESRFRRASRVLLGYLTLCLEVRTPERDKDPIRCEDSGLLRDTSERILESASQGEPLANGGGAEGTLDLSLALTILTRAWQARGEEPPELARGPQMALWFLLSYTNGKGQAKLLPALREVPLAVLERVVSELGADLAAFHSDVWQALLASEEEPQHRSPADFAGRDLERLFPQVSGASAAFWRSVPNLALTANLPSHVLRYDLLLPHQLDRAVVGRAHLPSELVRFAPLERLLARLSEVGPSAFEAGAIGALLERAPLVAVRLLLRRVLEQGDDSSLEALAAHGRLGSVLSELPALEELVLLPRERLQRVQELLLGLLRQEPLSALGAQAFQQLGAIEARTRAARPTAGER